MAKVKITQIKSVIDRPAKQKATMVALGLKRMHQTVEREDTPVVMGMVKAVSHLVKVEEA